MIQISIASTLVRAIELESKERDRERVGKVAKIKVVAEDWHAHPLGAADLVYSAVPGRSENGKELSKGFLTKGAWCSDSINASAMYINGPNSSPKKGQRGNIAVIYKNDVEEAKRPNIQTYEHYKTKHRVRVLGVLTIEIA